MDPDPYPLPPWAELRATAQQVVAQTIRRLPGSLQAHARSLPVTYHPVPDESLVADGYDPELLGLFVGLAYSESESGAVDLPPQIVLFLENLWDFAEADEGCYREEIQTTYLHELGHYLGLDEIDLEERGLE